MIKHKRTYKITVLTLLFLLGVNALFYAGATTISVSDLKQEILRQQGLTSGKEGGDFAAIIDKILDVGSDKINFRSYKIKDLKSKKNKFKPLPVGFYLLKDKNDNLKGISYYNRFLFPLESRNIDILFNKNGETLVKFRFNTLFGRIKKDITLRFKKGEDTPYNKVSNCSYWGETNSKNLFKKFDSLKKKIIEQNYVDPHSKNLGTLGGVTEALFALRGKPRPQDIFVIREQKIDNIPPQKLQADCFFIGVNVSIIVIYNPKSEIIAVDRIRRDKNKLEYKGITFDSQGMKYLDSWYDVSNYKFKLGSKKVYRIPYMKTEPEFQH